METLHIAEIPYESGEIKFRYERYLSEDQTKWIRHGMFRSYSRNGTVLSEGDYEHGSETGLWKEYHENGVLAAEGHYLVGEQTGTWRYWDENGNLEASEDY